MSVLSGKEILKQISAGNIQIEPFNLNNINPNSYNLTLANELLVYDEEVLDMRKPNMFKKLVIPDEGMILQPNKLYLGRTVERTATNNYVPMLEGRSSVGRLGLCIHVTAGFGDVGFDGYWTLELFCIEPILVVPNVQIGQIYYHTIEGEYDLYRSKYHGNVGIQPSMLWKDFARE